MSTWLDSALLCRQCVPMAPSPGTGGERPRRRRSNSPAGDAAAAGAGPPGSAMEVDDAGLGARRVYCPVPSCPCSDASRAPGWQSVSTMKDHVDAHISGALQGDLPTGWLQAQGRQRCPVCGLSVSIRHGTHPTCRPLARAAVGHGGGHSLLLARLCLALTRSKPARPQLCDTSRK